MSSAITSFRSGGNAYLRANVSYGFSSHSAVHKAESIGLERRCAGDRLTECKTTSLYLPRPKRNQKSKPRKGKYSAIEVDGVESRNRFCFLIERIGLGRSPEKGKVEHYETFFGLVPTSLEQALLFSEKGDYLSPSAIDGLRDLSNATKRWCSDCRT